MRIRWEKPLITGCIREHRAAILQRWLQRLGRRERELLTSMGANAHGMLEILFDEMIRRLEGEEVEAVISQLQPFPLDAAKRMLRLLMIGEEVVAATLAEHLELRMEDLAVVRGRINEIFHGMIRDHGEAVCDYCSWFLNEKMAQIKAGEASSV